MLAHQTGNTYLLSRASWTCVVNVPTVSQPNNITVINNDLTTTITLSNFSIQGALIPITSTTAIIPNASPTFTLRSLIIDYQSETDYSYLADIYCNEAQTIDLVVTNNTSIVYAERDGYVCTPGAQTIYIQGSRDDHPARSPNDCTLFTLTVDNSNERVEIQQPYVPPGFDPTSLPGLQLWLDATDASTVQKNEEYGLVVGWNDKSGNGNNAVGTGNLTTQNLTNGYPCIVTNSGYFNGPISITGQTYSAYIVAFSWVTGSLSVDMRLLSLARPGETDYFDFTTCIAAFQQGGKYSLELYRGGVNFSEYAPPPDYGVPFVCTSLVRSAIDPNHLLYVNGTLGQNTQYHTDQNFNISCYGIANQATPTTEVWYGGVSEVLIYNQEHSTVDQSNVETYLKTKYSIS